MDLEEARRAVPATLGPHYLLRKTTSRLVAGESLGSPTRQWVEVEVVYLPNPEIGPAPMFSHNPGELFFMGEGHSFEEALAVAFGDVGRRMS